MSVTALCPGFTHTSFHERMGLAVGEEGVPSFLWLDARDVVREGLRDAARGKSVSIPSLRYKAVVAVTKVLPRSSPRRSPVVVGSDGSRHRPRQRHPTRYAGRMTHSGNPFGQVLVALVTPMTADGEVDWPAVEKHIDDVITAGADGIVVTGTTGETSTLTDPEKLKLVEVGKSVSAGRAKIITGGGSNETAHAIELYKASEKAGADGIMIVTPYYNKPTQAGILTHFRLVADATDLPVILYDIPGRTGVPIKYETILRLAKHPNILAVKDAKGDFSEVSRVLNQTDLMYFSGDDANVLPHLSIGATGLIGVTANVASAPYRTIIDAVNRGDLATATAEHKRLEPLVRAVMTHVPGTVAAKYILHGLGRISSPRVRLPLVGPEEWEAALIEDELDLVSGVPGRTSRTSGPTATRPRAAPCRRCTARRAEPRHHERTDAWSVRLRRQHVHSLAEPSALDEGTLRVIPIGGLGRSVAT